MDPMALAKAPAVSLVAYTERRGDFTAAFRSALEWTRHWETAFAPST